MSKLQLLVGSEKLFLHLKYPIYYTWIGQSWLSSIWQWVSRVNFKISVQRACTPKLQQRNDRMLMDIFIELKYYPKEMNNLNKCRLYLQAIALSDIVLADGHVIIPYTLNGHRLQDRKSSLDWPNQ